MKKSLNIFLILPILVLLGSIFFFLLDKRQHVKPRLVDDITTPTPTASVTATSSGADSQVIKAIQALFGIKYSRDPNTVQLKITKSTDNFLVGSVNFSDEPGGGGVFFAVKENGSWVLLHDGNGIVPCDALSGVKFPSALQPQCFDTTKNVIEDRTENPEFSAEK